MLKHAIVPAIAAMAILASAIPAFAVDDDMGNIQSMMGDFPSGPDHGMPSGLAGGDGAVYDGAPNLQVAISLVTAGGAPGHFSIARALSEMAGPAVEKAEVAKLNKQYGEKRVSSYVIVQNYAVDDAVRVATAAGVTFPSPELHGAELANKVVDAGLIDGTYYEGFMLDHAVSNKVHDAVMGDIDEKYGTVADANYHLISDQAHYDLAQALGASSVKLSPYH